jgi:biopolymer transport protein ExbD
MKGNNYEEIKADITPMIDVVFLLIIFFILMPPKKIESKLESYVPKDNSKVTGDFNKTMFFIEISSKIKEQQNISTVKFNRRYICKFKT